MRRLSTIPERFFRYAAFVSVDLQEGERPANTTDTALPADWRDMGFTADDVNAANRHAWEVCRPNAIQVCLACRGAGLPMIFNHWGFQLPGGMDLDPVIRNTMLRNHGSDAKQWPGHMAHPHSSPLKAFDICEGEYVIAKTAQDAFPSSPLNHVLVNLSVRNLIMIGGHTEACLGKTATSARRLGYRTLCVEDATNNARESTRMRGIREAQFHYVVTTEKLVEALRTLG